ncbi:uncharacterized protein LOC142235613 [Haematobia irritans]|uniref:uncharacterized protein LOC142235613 n=1 Tax=Haematobia irritans TaxID=7368 RepID=UPI003F505489
MDYSQQTNNNNNTNNFFEHINCKYDAKTTFGLKNYCKAKLNTEKFSEFNLELNEEWFINKTDVPFPKECKWILSLGSKFALPVNQNNFAPVPLIADIEQWVQSIDDTKEKETLRGKIANRITNYKRNARNNGREKFILGIYEETKSVIERNKDIMVTTADKGNKTVVLYKNEYREKMRQLLNDKNTYKVMDTDPTEKLEKINNRIVTELYNNKLLTKWEKLKLTSVSAKSPELYGLPKIHKEGTPLRPISSSMNVPCYQLSKYIGSILKNIISIEYNTVNSLNLKQKLKSVILEDDDIIVSFDVVSLFTNIPTHLAIKNIMDKWEILKKNTTIPKLTFLKILNFCLKDNNYFMYSGKVYQQTYGMPMGNPLSPTIADIVLDTLLDDVLNELKDMNVKVKFITKYVDDLFAVIKREDEDTIMKLLNAYHNKIKFTIEKEKNGELPFLDMTIIRKENSLMTNWYAKPTSSGRMINFYSTQPYNMKINTAKNFIHKVLQLSEEIFKSENLMKIKNILKANNYPMTIINNLVQQIINGPKEKKCEDTIKTKKFFSQHIDRMKLSVEYSQKSTAKNKTDKLKLNNVVYEITCDGNKQERCNKKYVGTTKRALGTRLAEHEAGIRKEKETTALAQHIKESGHKANFKTVRILDREKIENKRYTLENLRIQQRLQISINTKEDKDNTKLQYSIAIT